MTDEKLVSTHERDNAQSERQYWQIPEVRRLCAGEAENAPGSTAEFTTGS